MKTFLVTWKQNSGFRHSPSVIRGTSFTEALYTHFHKDAMKGVSNYEEIFPWFMNIVVSSFQYPLPITLYYTQHGNGKIYIKWLDGMVTEDIRKAVMNTSKKDFIYIQEVAKDIYRQLNKE